MQLRSEYLFIVASAGVFAASPGVAHAVPPLATLVADARDHGFDARVADATAERAEADRAEARSRLLPSFTASGTYAHNQYDAVATLPTAGGGTRQATFIAHDQLDGTFALEVPLVDIASLVRLRGRGHALDAARSSRDAAVLEVTRRTALAYYDLVAGIALVTSTERSETVSRESLRVLRVRLSAGLVSELDVARAEAEAERRASLAADARRLRDDARRALELLVGHEVDVEPVALDPSLDEAAALATFLASAGALPAVMAADANAEAARSERAAARAGALPTLVATASERFTSAPGFGHQPTYQIGLRASLRLDFGIPARSRAASATVDSLDVAAERARAEAENAIASAWGAVESSRQRVVASRASSSAADRAVRVAQAGREAGTVTQLELDQAERDAFEAEVAVIQAEATLEASRAQLYLVSGRELP